MAEYISWSPVRRLMKHNGALIVARDAVDELVDWMSTSAIKINGSGATCLIYNGKDIYFPSKASSRNNEEKVKINQKILNYFKSKIEETNVKFEPDDVIIIGSGNNPQKSRLATLNAALTLF
ncbi:unnamed protein product [marine sediment metagenome]|uniref:DUF4443 domain-containing protein n=1 Tax=marine sediment metagenome TaxID=412755 RepID=X1AE64_9ZZZZ